MSRAAKGQRAGWVQLTSSSIGSIARRVLLVWVAGLARVTRPLWPSIPPAAQRIASAIVIAIAIGLPASQVIALATRFNPEDITSYLWAGEAWRTLGNPYAPAPELIGFNPIYRYAPWFAVPWIYLDTLPHGIVAAAWTAAMVVCAAVAVVPLFRARTRAAFVLGAFMLGWLVAIALQGNVQPAIVAMLAWTLNGRYGPATIALAASLKFTPILYVLVYLGRREWSRAGLTLLATAALVAPMAAFEIPAVMVSTAGWASLFRDAPIVWGAIVVIACVAAIALARSRFGWVAACVAVIVALPRAFNYDVTFVLPGVTQAAPDPADSSSRPPQHRRIRRAIWTRDLPRTALRPAAQRAAVIWGATAVALVLWVTGLILRIGEWAHLLLVAAAVLLACEVIAERRSRGRGLVRPSLGAERLREPAPPE